MVQVLVRATDGLVTTVLPQAHTWGTCERWPDFVVLSVEGEEAAVHEAIDANRDKDGFAYIAIDGLSEATINALAKDDRAGVAMRDLQFSTAATPSKLVAATAARSDEQVAFDAWMDKLGEAGDAPADSEKRAAEAAARLELEAKRGGKGATGMPPRKGLRA
jgi:hypothetical protein